MTDSVETANFTRARNTNGRRGGGNARGAAAQADQSTGSSARRNVQTDEKGRVHPFMWLIFAAFLLPVELSIYLGSLFMTPLKGILMAIAIPAIAMFFSRCKIGLPDYLFFAYVFYTAICILIKRKANGLEPSIVFILEWGIVYIATRISIRNVEDLKAITKAFIIFLIILGFTAIPEAVYKYRFLHKWAEAITGITYDHAIDERMGMLRANATFEHPILFALACSSMITYGWIFAKSAGRGVIAGLGLLNATFWALSSAAFIVIFLQVSVIIGERMSRFIQNRAKWILYIFVFFYAFLSVASNRGPVGLVAAYLTLNPWTGYYRILIWENGIDDVIRSPIIGIKPEQWTRPGWMTPSIDNFWLLVMMKGGIPSFIFLMGMIIFLVWNLQRLHPKAFGYAPTYNPMNAKQIREAKAAERAVKRGGKAKALQTGIHPGTGWVIVMVALAFGGSTVHFFGKMQPIFAMHLAFGTALLAIGVDQLAKQEAQEAAERPPDSDEAVEEKGRGRGKRLRPKRGR